MVRGERSEVAALRVTREESRTVLDHQIALQKDIDDEALRTVRLSLVLVALAVSVIRLMDPTQIGEIGFGTVLSAAAGLVLLLLAIFVSLGVYLETEIPFGIGTGHRQEVMEEPYTERDWLEALLEEYNRWTEEALKSNEFNARWLTRAQTSMAAGVVYLVASTVVAFSPLSPGFGFLGVSVVGGVALLLYYLVSSSEAVME